MAIHIQSGKKYSILTTNQVTENIHNIPFEINADCDAEVSKYFHPRQIEKGLSKASFRGYPMLGKELEVPEGYTGLILHETVRPASKEEDRKFYVIHTFNKFKCWNWGKAPSQNDALIQALEWVDIAEALHSPVK